MFDKDKNSQVTFQNFIVTLSNPLKGTQQEKHEWLFDLFDGNQDGRLSKTEMLSVIQVRENKRIKRLCERARARGREREREREGGGADRQCVRK